MAIEEYHIHVIDGIAHRFRDFNLLLERVGNLQLIQSLEIPVQAFNIDFIWVPNGIIYNHNLQNNDANFIGNHLLNADNA